MFASSNGRNNRRSSEEASNTTSKMKHRRHLTAVEWYEISGVVSYIDLDRSEFLAQQGQVLDVLEMSRYRMSVLSLYRNDPQRPIEGVADDASFNDVRVDVQKFKLLRHIHHGLHLFHEGV